MTRSENMTPIEYARLACDIVMREIPAPDLPQKGRFHYVRGVFLSGMENIYLETGEEKYYNYIKEWVDSNIIEDGTVRFHYRDKLDDLQAARLLYLLYDKTGAPHYKKVIDDFIGYIERRETTPVGGLWHMHNKPEQMWLDGLYMAGSLVLPYAKRHNRADLFDLICRQVRLIFENMRDAKTGLLYHAWDYSRQMEWADKTTGLSPEFWGRSIGWVCLFLADMQDFLPREHRDSEYVRRCLCGLLSAVAGFQNERNGLWYQGVDKGDVCGNWTETSCTALFSYALAKAVRIGCIDEKYRENALRGYESIIKSLYLRDGGLYMPCICEGTGVGDYNHYITRRTGINDLHGLGAFVMLCCEIDKLLR